MFLRDITMDDVKGVKLPTKATLWDALLATAVCAKQILREAEAPAKRSRKRKPPADDDVAASKRRRNGRQGAEQQEAARARARPKRKPAAAEDEDDDAASKRRRRDNNRLQGAEQAPPLPLPQEFRTKIDEVARERNAPPPEVRIVIQKNLYKTDTTRGHNRLSIPIAQIDDDFLTAEEWQRLDSKLFIEVTILDPSLRTVNVKLNKWSFPKDNGGSAIYVINGRWNDIVEKNGLEEGMIVQLWCFRVQQDLCFALVLLPPQFHTLSIDG